MKPTRRAAVLSFSAVLATLASAAPQDPTVPEGEREPPTPLEALEAMETPEDELVALFGKVETRLREIDRMLYDASAGRPVSGAEESGIGELLKATLDASEQVLSGIDRILEVAQERQQQQQQQQSPGGQGGQQDGESPLDRPQDRPGEREQTPDSPSGAHPDEEQPPTSEDGRPESPEEASGDPDNRLGNNPPTGPTERVAPGTGNDAWGDLPVHVRDLFRAQGGGDLPPRYRDWIDAYYRRLNQKP